MEMQRKVSAEYHFYHLVERVFFVSIIHTVPSSLLCACNCLCKSNGVGRITSQYMWYAGRQKNQNLKHERECISFWNEFIWGSVKESVVDINGCRRTRRKNRQHSAQGWNFVVCAQIYVLMMRWEYILYIRSAKKKQKMDDSQCEVVQSN